MNRDEFIIKGDEFFQAGNYLEAIKWYKKSSDNGNFFATYNIACMYYFGDGVKRNVDEAIAYFIKATEQGDKEAANRLGTIFLADKKDKENALKYLKLSADKKSLGGLHSYGQLLLDDGNVEGLKYIEEASKLGNGEASLFIGKCYEAGTYFEKDVKKAFEYYLKAANLRVNEAEAIVSKCYKEGIGVNIDLEKAKYYEEMSKIPYTD